MASPTPPRNEPPIGVENRRTCTASPTTASHAHANRISDRRSSRPPIRKPRTSPTGTAKRMNTALGQSVRVGQDVRQLRDVVLGVAEHEPLEDRRGGHLPEPGMRADAGPLRLGQGRHPIRPGGEPCVDPGEQHPQRQRPVTIDDAEPEAVVRGPPERHGVGSGPVDDALQLAQPEGQHLLDVRQDLARAPRRLRPGPDSPRPAATALRPSREGRARRSRVARPRSDRRRSSWRPVWHARRTMVALTNASAAARARPRPDPPAAENAR